MSIVIQVNPYRASSIQKAIDDLKAFKEKLKTFPNEYVKAMTEEFNNILGEEAPSGANGLWVHRVQESEDGKAEGIIVFAGKVEFIEFGTGIVGEYNHAGVNEEWFDRLPPPYNKGYDTGYWIDEITHEWSYYEGGKWHRTKGQVANPFIYRSVQRLLEEKARIAKQILNLR